MKDAITRASWAGSAVFAVVAVSAAATGANAIEAVAVIVDLLLFVGGVIAYALAYAAAVRRSRRDEIAVANLFLLMGPVAPAAVKRRLLGAAAAQGVVAVATAAVRPYSPLAFGILVPLWGLGLAGLWAARHGTFPRRKVTKNRTGRRA